MLLHRITIIVLIFTGLVCHQCGNAQDAADQPAVRLKHGWTNVFAGKPASLDCAVAVAGDATMSWSIALEGGVIARGERALQPRADRPGEVTIDVDFPELRPGVIAPATFRLDVRSKQGKSSQTVNLYVFSPDVAANREQWLKSLDIGLFDPAKKTQGAFTASRIPHRLVEEPGPNNGLIIHGEGIEPSRQKASWEAALSAAATGRRVIVLASSGATVPAEGLLAANVRKPSMVSVRNSDVIRELDKRLDAGEWPLPGRLVKSSLQWTAKRDVSQFELRDDATGWPWLDVRYPNGGRLVWTGFGLIESWESTPAARYLMVKLLEDVMVEKPETGGSRNVP